MTSKEKGENPIYKTTGGYLKTYNYKDAFKFSWEGATDEDKELLFKLPNFDAEIFKEISGIDVNEKTEPLINIAGVDYKVSDIENALKVVAPVINKKDK